MQGHAATWCTCEFWAGWAPFLPSFLVEEQHWGMHAHCWAWNILENWFTEEVEQKCRRWPQNRSGSEHPSKTGRQQVLKFPGNEKASEHRSKTVPPNFPAQAAKRSEMKTVRERFRNGTGREPFWNRFGTVSEPFPDPFWVTCHLGVLFSEPFRNPFFVTYKDFWGTLFRTFSGTRSRDCRLTCQCGGGNFQTHAFEGTSLPWSATTLVKCFGHPLW